MIRMRHLARTRNIAALFAGLALLFSVVVAVCGTYPALADDENISQEMSIKVLSPDDMPELAEMEIPVHVYCIAEPDDEGVLQPTNLFRRIADPLGAYSGNPADETAKALIAAATLEANLLSSNPDISQTITGGEGVINVPNPGLYLLLPQAAYHGDTLYNFNSLLVPVPYRLEDGELAYAQIGAVLKGAPVPPDNPDVPDEARGSLEIVKSLSAMDTSLGNPTFVFNVTATDAAGATLFNKVVAFSFTEAGQKSQIIDGIPLGTTITVTEVYSGASYTATTDTTQAVTISADNREASVTFENQPNDDRKGGTGIENAFAKGPDGWKLVQRTAECEEAA